MTLRPQAVLTLVMLAFFGTLSAIALTFPPSAALMPLIIGIPAVILCLVQLFSDLRAGIIEGDTHSGGYDAGHQRFKAELSMFFWIFAFLVGILAFGFVFAAPVLVLAFIWLGSREKFIYGLFGAIGTEVILYLVFDRLLGLTLFSGFVTPLLF